MNSTRAFFLTALLPVGLYIFHVEIVRSIVRCICLQPRPTRRYFWPFLLRSFAVDHTCGKNSCHVAYYVGELFDVRSPNGRLGDSENPAVLVRNGSFWVIVYDHLGQEDIVLGDHDLASGFFDIWICICMIVKEKKKTWKIWIEL